MEKIIQIAYWLRPLDSQRTAGFLETLADSQTQGLSNFPIELRDGTTDHALIVRLAPLISRTPRAIKRFLNLAPC